DELRLPSPEPSSTRSLPVLGETPRLPNSTEPGVGVSASRFTLSARLPASMPMSVPNAPSRLPSSEMPSRLLVSAGDSWAAARPGNAMAAPMPNAPTAAILAVVRLVDFRWVLVICVCSPIHVGHDVSHRGHPGRSGVRWRRYK